VIALQKTSISKLTKQISATKLENEQIINCFDKLAAQMATLIAQAASPKKRPTGGHDSGSSTST